VCVGVFVHTYVSQVTAGYQCVRASTDPSVSAVDPAASATESLISVGIFVPESP
jgi:hypothetical protein